MGELTTPSLTAAVSEAGGLGGLGMWVFPVKKPNVGERLMNLP